MMMVLLLGGGLDQLARVSGAAEIELLDLSPLLRSSANRARPQWDGDQSRWLVKCDNSHQSVITGWYQQLQQHQKAGLLRNAGNLKGVILRTECLLTSLTALNTRLANAPFLNNWSATLELRYEFGMIQDNAFALSLSGGSAKSVDSIKVSARGVAVRVLVDWYAKTQELAVEVVDLDDPQDSGIQYLEGRYFATGRSVTSTLSSKQELSLSYSMTAEPKKDPSNPSSPAPAPKQTVAVSGSSYMDLTKKRMRVVTDGCAYVVAYGVFNWIENRRSDGSLQVDISLSAELVSDVNLTVQQTLQEKSADCKGQRAIAGSVTFTDKVTDASASLSNKVECGILSTAIPYNVAFSVAPTRDGNKPDSQALEGMKAQCRWFVDTGAKTAFYQPGFRNGLTYKFSATTANGVSGASILVKSDATDSRVTRKKYLPITWK
jgi:hypothetical protein